MKNIDLIFNYIKDNLDQNKWVQYNILKKYFSWENWINESTLTRNLKKLIEQDIIRKVIDWDSVFYFLSWKVFVEEYLKVFYLDREKKKYNQEFLRSYVPNKTSFLWKNNYKKIKEKLNWTNMLSTMDYMRNRRWIENMLIDLSYVSSRMEWNTYSYLDTEILIKYNKEADWKTQFETQMVLNHKNAIDFIIENKDLEKIDRKYFFQVHKLLWENLIHFEYLWKIRQNEVMIGKSRYSPMKSFFELENEFNLFLEKLNEIKNPFEQSLFILVFIPYFQIFYDINKRTSRISSNIPLISNWLPPFTFLQVKEKDYINAILSIYELNDVKLMSDLFAKDYLLNFENYVVKWMDDVDK